MSSSPVQLTLESALDYDREFGSSGSSSPPPATSRFKSPFRSSKDSAKTLASSTTATIRAPHVKRTLSVSSGEYEDGLPRPPVKRTPPVVAKPQPPSLVAKAQAGKGNKMTLEERRGGDLIKARGGEESGILNKSGEGKKMSGRLAPEGAGSKLSGAESSRKTIGGEAGKKSNGESTSMLASLRKASGEAVAGLSKTSGGESSINLGKTSVNSNMTNGESSMLAGLRKTGELNESEGKGTAMSRKSSGESIVSARSEGMKSTSKESTAKLNTPVKQTAASDKAIPANKHDAWMFDPFAASHVPVASAAKPTTRAKPYSSTTTTMTSTATSTINSTSLCKSSSSGGGLKHPTVIRAMPAPPPPPTLFPGPPKTQAEDDADIFNSSASSENDHSTAASNSSTLSDEENETPFFNVMKQKESIGARAKAVKAWVRKRAIDVTLGRNLALHWSTREVCEFLQACGLGNYRHTFESNGVDGPVLMDLTLEQVSRGLHMTNDRHLESFVLAIKSLKKRTIRSTATWEWSCAKVCEWLDRRGFHVLVETFRQYAVHGGVLFEMNDEDFATHLGVGKDFPLILTSLMAAIDRARVAGPIPKIMMIPDWSMGQVQTWLGSLSLGHLNEDFRSHCVNGSLLLMMDAKTFREELGATEIQSIVLERAVDKLQKAYVQEKSIVNASVKTLGKLRRWTKAGWQVTQRGMKSFTVSTSHGTTAANGRRIVKKSSGEARSPRTKTVTTMTVVREKQFATPTAATETRPLRPPRLAAPAARPVDFASPVGPPPPRDDENELDNSMSVM